MTGIVNKTGSSSGAVGETVKNDITISASEPTGREGGMWWDTSIDRMRIYDGSAWQFVEEVGSFSEEILFDKPGTYMWTVPTGVSTFSAVAIGGGGSGGCGNSGQAGGGGGLAYRTAWASVTAGDKITVNVGRGGIGTDPKNSRGSAVGTEADFGTKGGMSYVSDFAGNSMWAMGGDGGTGDGSGSIVGAGGAGGIVGGHHTGGGTGGSGGQDDANHGGPGGGGAGGYSGTGGAGGTPTSSTSTESGAVGGGGGGGGGGKGGSAEMGGGGGGGTGLYGTGTAGTAGQGQSNGNGGQPGGGGSGAGGGTLGFNVSNGPAGHGGWPGGGGGGTQSQQPIGQGASGGVRIIWGTSRTFPSNAAEQT